MPEIQYYSDKEILITNVKLIYNGSIYPISTVMAVQVTKLPASVMEKHDQMMGGGAILLLFGLGLVITVIFNIFGIRNLFESPIPLGFLGLVLIFGGWHIAAKEWTAYSKDALHREVHVRFASGNNLVIHTLIPQSAKTICDAIDQAITLRETSVIISTSVADELGKLAALRDAGIISSDDWERAKDLYLGKRPDERAEVIEQLKKLYDLRRDGVLSEAEFNIKKWDMLSRSK